MSWRLADDPHNPENRNAGNGGDLVKHCAYATLLDVLLAESPWHDGLHLRECHAGRALYRIPAGDPRRRLAKVVFEGGHRLAEAQRRALSIWRLPTDGSWYAGSAAVNATRLAHHPGAHRYEGYEWAPDTRAIARQALEEGFESSLPLRLPDGPPPLSRFEGESHIAGELAHWSERDVVLLDPFGLWRRRKLAERRRRYARIVDAHVRAQAPPPLAWFFVWSHEEAGDSDMNGRSTPVADGYQELLSRLVAADRRPIVLRWRWDLVCAMWLIVPPRIRDRLGAELEANLAELATVATEAGVGPERLSVAQG